MSIKKNKGIDVAEINKISPTSSQVHVPTAGKEKEVNKDELTPQGRDQIAEHNFALPDERYPIHDISHARNALARVAQHGSAEEKAKVRAAVYRKYPSLRPISKSQGTRRVATVAVRHAGKLLMGKRRDNGLWTTPGGHLEPDEDFPEGALRELQEETGIESNLGEIKPAGEVEKLKDKGGKDLHVQGFTVDLAEKPTTSMREDPDNEVERWQWIDTSSGLPKDIAGRLHTPLERNILMKHLGFWRPEAIEASAFSVNKMEDEILKGAFDEIKYDNPVIPTGDAQRLYGYQLLLEGMDWELSHVTRDPKMARDSAMEQLQEDPFYYKKLNYVEDRTDDKLEKDTRDDAPWESDQGFNLDLGSGTTREPGHIGFDLYPYDHGTIVHDIRLGIPLPSESCKSVRMANVETDPKEVLSEIHRVLMPGGQFVYQGQDDIYNYPNWGQDYPGLVLVNHEGVIEKTGVFRQVFTRVVLPDPATANDAQPRLTDMDTLPADLVVASDAIKACAKDDSGSDSQGAGDSNQKLEDVKEDPLQTLVNQILNPVNPNPPPPKMPKRGSAAEKVLKEDKVVPIFKANRVKQIVYGVVLAPNEIDSQNDIMFAEDIEKTAHEYLKDARVIGSVHTHQIKAYPVESFIAPQDFEVHGQYGNQMVTKGSWVLGVKIDDPVEWQKVENGDYTGFSVGGFGERLTV